MFGHVLDKAVNVFSFLWDLNLCFTATSVYEYSYDVYGFNIILESATLPAKTLNMLYLKLRIRFTGLVRGFEVKSSYFLCLKWMVDSSLLLQTQFVCLALLSFDYLTFLKSSMFGIGKKSILALNLDDFE